MILILHALLQRAYVSKASEAGIEYFPAFFVSGAFLVAPGSVLLEAAALTAEHG